jgi:hypothetical protein
MVIIAALAAGTLNAPFLARLRCGACSRRWLGRFVYVPTPIVTAMPDATVEELVIAARSHRDGAFAATTTAIDS